MPIEAASFITRLPVEIFGRYPGYGFAGIGVSTAVGNFTQTSFDLTFPPGLQGLLAWQRTYNSHSGAVAVPGTGWTTSFSASLVVRATHQPSGRYLAFSHDANRRLTSLQASDGRAVAFGYSAGDVTSAVLGSVTAPGGGVTRFDWSGTGQAAQVSQITDPDGNLVVANTLRVEACYLDVCRGLLLICSGRGLIASGDYFRAGPTGSNTLTISSGAVLTTPSRDPAAVIQGNTPSASTAARQCGRWRSSTASSLRTWPPTAAASTAEPAPRPGRPDARLMGRAVDRLRRPGGAEHDHSHPGPGRGPVLSA